MELKPLVKNSIQQNYLCEAYPLYYPSYQKCFPSVGFPSCPYHIWNALPLRQNLLFGENPVDGRGGNPASSLPLESPNTSIIYSYSHYCCIIFFLTSDFMCRYIILIVIRQWLLNLICSTTKTMNDENSSN